MYPNNTKTRAVIHQRLFHDSSEFYVRILDIANLAFTTTTSPAVITVQHKENLKKAMTVLEVNNHSMNSWALLATHRISCCVQNFLEGFDYFAGNQITIADLSYLASMTTLIVSHSLTISQPLNFTLRIQGIWVQHSTLQERQQLVPSNEGHSGLPRMPARCTRVRRHRQGETHEFLWHCLMKRIRSRANKIIAMN